MKTRKRNLLTLLLMALLTAGTVLGTSFSSEARVYGEWKHNEKGYWYEYASGEYETEKWDYLDGKWYYFNKYGYRCTGWKLINADEWYYFNPDGTMFTGWKKIKGIWYYFQTSGLMATGWKKIKGTWYFFLYDGQMVKDSRWKIGKKLFEFDASGACTTPEGLDLDRSLYWTEAIPEWRGKHMNYYDCAGMILRSGAVAKGCWGSKDFIYVDHYDIKEHFPE